jgi:hypothetical protein
MRGGTGLRQLCVKFSRNIREFHATLSENILKMIKNHQFQTIFLIIPDGMAYADFLSLAKL